MTAHCKKTGVVDLEHRQLTSASQIAWVWQLQSLRVLKLDHNELPSLGIPSDVVMPELEEVSARYNKLTAVPEFNPSHTFRMLDVRNNEIQDLPKTFSVLLTKSEMVILGEGYRKEYNVTDQQANYFLNPKWRGWHGREPVDGHLYSFQCWGRSYWGRPYQTLRIHTAYKSIPGFRIFFEDNPVERKLRELLGMDEDDAFDARRLADYLRRVAEEEAAANKEGGAGEDGGPEEPDYAAIKEAKREAKAERERQRKVKEKAIKKQGAAKARQKGGMD